MTIERMVMFKKVKIKTKTSNFAEINEKRPSSEKYNFEKHGLTTLTPEVTSSQVMMGLGVDEGHCLDDTPSTSPREVSIST